MRLLTTVLLSLCCVSSIAAQTTTPPTTPPTTKRAASPAATTTLSVTVTDGKGAALSGVAVRLSGPLDREAQTEQGTVRLEGLRGGTYRLRFTRDGFITLERDVTVPAGQRLLDQHVMLSVADKPAAAPTPPPPAPEPAKPPPPPPPGKAMTLSVPDFIERNFITNTQPQKVSPVGCSGLAQTVLWQIREPWENRQQSDADAMLYVVSGEGSLKLDGRDVPILAGSFAVVPRGASYGLTRRSRNPLMVLATLAGPPCAP